MKKIRFELEEKTVNDLISVGIPLQEDVDAIIQRLVKFYKKNSSAPTGSMGTLFSRAAALTSKTKRSTNPDALNKFLRPQYRRIPYQESIPMAFIKEGQARLSVASIVSLLFDFPNDPQKQDRVSRATASLTIAMRYNAGAKIFKEPVFEVFELIGQGKDA